MAYAQRMLETHPWPGHVDREALAECIEACFECEQSCTACADACLSEEQVDQMRKCIRLDLDCAEICSTTGRILSRQTEYDAPTSKAQIEACLQACRSCGDECAAHAEHHEHCRVCAEACSRCAESCEALLQAMK